MTEKEAYLATYAFLEHYYEITKSDYLGTLLSSMMLLPDGDPVDAAIWGDWRDAVRKALSGEVKAELVLRRTW